MQNIEKGLWGFKLNWFSDKLRKEIGNGVETSLWEDPWLEGVPLKIRYPRLFVLSEENNVCVMEV